MDQKKNQGQADRTTGTGSDSTRNRSSESERGSSSESMRNRGSESDRGAGGSSSASRGSTTSRDSAGGITNRSMDEELSEQEELPERGSRQSER